MPRSEYAGRCWAVGTGADVEPCEAGCTLRYCTAGVMACDEPTSPAVQKATAIFHITRAELNLQADALHLVRDHLKAARDALRNAGVKGLGE